MPKGHYQLSEEQKRIKSEKIKATKAKNKLTPEQLVAKSSAMKQYYVDHPEARQKLSESTKKQFAEKGHPSMGLHHSEEAKAKMRKSRLAYFEEHPEAKENIRQHQLDRLSNKENHPMYGKRFSEESKLKMSLSHIRYINSSEDIKNTIIARCMKLISVNRGKSGYRKDIACFVRSRMEANYIRILRYIGINFEYEATRFKLSSGKTYIPDFYFPDKGEYIELKGYLKEADKIKQDLFRKEYPDVKWRMIEYKSKEWIELETKYRPLIKEWEA